MKLWVWRRANAQCDEEMRTHLDKVTQAHVERGAGRRNAESTARREFGNVELAKQTARDQEAVGKVFLNTMVEQWR